MVPTWAPPVCVAGVTWTPYAPAIGVTNGEPVVKNPLSASALKPSLTIDFTLFFRALAIETVNVRVMLPPAAMLTAGQVTLPLPNVPPSDADTNVVFAGTGSVSTTLLAVALPSFRSVIVYCRLEDGPTGTPASTFESTSAGDVVVSIILNAPRPCVPAASTRWDESKSSCQMAEIGMLFAVPSADHVPPPLKVTKAPTSVPT